MRGVCGLAGATDAEALAHDRPALLEELEGHAAAALDDQPARVAGPLPQRLAVAEALGVRRARMEAHAALPVLGDAVAAARSLEVEVERDVAAVALGDTDHDRRAR